MQYILIIHIFEFYDIILNLLLIYFSVNILLFSFIIKLLIINQIYLNIYVFLYIDIDSIPEDIFYNILSQLHASNSSFNNINYRDLYKLRIVNKSFKYYIDNIKNCKLCNNVNSYENIFNRLAYSGLFCNFSGLYYNLSGL